MARPLEIAIVGDASKFLRELKRAESGVQRFSRAAGVAGTAILGGLAVGLTKAAKGAMEDEIANNRLATAFKNMHEPIQKFTQRIEASEKAGIKLGFQDEEVAKSLGSLVTATGSGTKSLSLLSEAEDLARFKHTSLEAGTKMLTAAMAGNVRAAKQLGIVIPKSLTDPQQKAAFVIEEVRKRVHGQAQSFSDTAAGGLATYRAQMDRLQDNIGKGVLPAFNKLLEIVGAVAEFFSKHTTTTKVLVAVLGGLAVAMVAVSVATQLANLAFLASPVGLVIIGLAALVVGIVELIKHWDDVTVAMGKVWDYISGTFLGIWDSLKNAIKSVKDWVADHWPEIATLLSGPFALILAPATNAFGVRDKLTAAFTAVKDWAKDRISDVVGFFGGMGDRIWSAFSSGWNTIKGNISGAFDAVKGWASDVISGTVSLFGGLPGKVGGAIGDAMHFLKDKLASLFSWKTIVGWIREALGFGSPSPHFMAIGGDIVDSMVRGVGAAAGLLKDAVTRLATQVLGDVATLGPHVGAPTRFGGALTEPQQRIVALGHALQGMGFQVSENPAFGGVSPVHAPNSYHYKGRAIDVNWPGGGPVELGHLYKGETFARGWNPIEDMIEDAGRSNQHLHVALAKGGIVKSPTMALIGERGPEAVVPLDRMGGGDIVIHHQTVLDGRVIEESVRRETYRYQARNGTTGYR